MGALSRLTGDPRFESAALRALRKLWSMRSSLNLLGTTLDVQSGEWIEYSSGIGAGMSCWWIVVHELPNNAVLKTISQFKFANRFQLFW